MKITRTETTILRIPEDDPLADMPEESGRLRPIVILRIQTDSGIEGIGLTFYGGALTGTLRSAVDELGALLIGEDPLRIEAILRKLGAAAGDSCGSGIYTLAVSAIDVALWDIKGKALEQPLWKLLGGARERVNTYASGSLRRGLTDAQAATAARRLVDKGFIEMKTQMALPGNPSPAEEVRRARVVRDAIGPDIKLMCDINQRWRRGAGDRHRSSRCGCRAVLAGGRHHLRRLCRARAGQRGAVHADRRRRVRLGDHAVPQHDRGAFGRLRDDRPVPRRRRDAVDEGRRHGGGVQSAGGQPRGAGDAPAPDRRGAERADGGIHAVDAEALRGDAGDREGAVGAAEQAGSGAEVRREGGGGVSGGGEGELPGRIATATEGSVETPDIAKQQRRSMLPSPTNLDSCHCERSEAIPIAFVTAMEIAASLRSSQ